MSRSNDPLRKDAQLPLRVRLFRLQRGLCWWCESPMRNEGDQQHNLYATVDHIVGLRAGGGNHQYNKLLAHRLCNQARGSVPAHLIGAPAGTTVRMFQRQQIMRLQHIAEQRNEVPKDEWVTLTTPELQHEAPPIKPVEHPDGDGDSADDIYRLPAPPM